MLRRICEYMRGMSVLVSDVAVAGILLALFPLSLNWNFYIALPYWVAVLAVQFLINDLMMEKGISMNLYLAFNAAAIAGSLGLILNMSYCIPESPSLMIFLGFLVSFVGGHCAWIAYRMPGSNTILPYVDALIVLFAFSLYAAHQVGKAYPGEYAVLVLAAMILDLLAVNQLRTGEEAGTVIQGAGTGGKIILAGIALGSLLITGVIVGMASGQVHDLVDLLLMVMGTVCSVISEIFSLIGRLLTPLIMFLLLLFPATPMSAREQMMMQIQEEVTEIAEEADAVLPAWVLPAMLAIGVLVLIGMVLYHLRGVKIGRKRVVREKRKIIRKSRFFLALKEILIRLRDQMEMEFKYQRYKKTPQGLLILAERVGKENRMPRNIQESPGEYLRRLSAEMKCDLTELAMLLDRIYYAGEDCHLAPGAYRRYAEEIRQMHDFKMKKEEKKTEKTVDTRERV